MRKRKTSKIRSAASLLLAAIMALNMLAIPAMAAQVDAIGVDIDVETPPTDDGIEIWLDPVDKPYYWSNELIDEKISCVLAADGPNYWLVRNETAYTNQTAPWLYRLVLEDKLSASYEVLSVTGEIQTGSGFDILPGDRFITNSNAPAGSVMNLIGSPGSEIDIKPVLEAPVDIPEPEIETGAFFVADYGNDDSNGTETAPLATLTAAFAAVAENQASNGSRINRIILLTDIESHDERIEIADIDVMLDGNYHTITGWDNGIECWHANLEFFNIMIDFTGSGDASCWLSAIQGSRVWANSATRFRYGNYGTWIHVANSDLMFEGVVSNMNVGILFGSTTSRVVLDASISEICGSILTSVRDEKLYVSGDIHNCQAGGSYGGRFILVMGSTEGGTYEFTDWIVQGCTLYDSVITCEKVIPTVSNCVISSNLFYDEACAVLNVENLGACLETWGLDGCSIFDNTAENANVIPNVWIQSFSNAFDLERGLYIASESGLVAVEAGYLSPVIYDYAGRTVDNSGVLFNLGGKAPARYLRVFNASDLSSGCVRVATTEESVVLQNAINTFDAGYIIAGGLRVNSNLNFAFDMQFYGDNFGPPDLSLVSAIDPHTIYGYVCIPMNPEGAFSYTDGIFVESESEAAAPIRFDTSWLGNAHCDYLIGLVMREAGGITAPDVPVPEFIEDAGLVPAELEAAEIVNPASVDFAEQEAVDEPVALWETIGAERVVLVGYSYRLVNQAGYSTPDEINGVYKLAADKSPVYFQVSLASFLNDKLAPVILTRSVKFDGELSYSSYGAGVTMIRWTGSNLDKDLLPEFRGQTMVWAPKYDAFVGFINWTTEEREAESAALASGEWMNEIELDISVRDTETRNLNSLDINQDGSVNLYDSGYLMNVFRGAASLVDCIAANDITVRDNYIRCDINGDGVVDSKDFVAWTSGNLPSVSVMYTVVFDPNGGAGGGSYQVAHGDAVPAVEVPSRAGFVFNGWFIDGEPLDVDTLVLGDMTIKAQWVSNSTPVVPTPVDPTPVEPV